MSTGNRNVFENKAEAYVKGRPGYAPGALETIAEALPPSAGQAAADMGSGTGIFARELLERGYEVWGVEPSRAMGEKARERLGRFRGFHLLEAAAEDTGLAGGSVGLVTAASAFHWFDTGRFRRECGRILRPGGMVFLLANARVSGDELSLEQEALCRRHCPGFTSLRRCSDFTEAARSDFFIGGGERRAFPYDLAYSQEEFLARCLSSSYSPAPGEAGYAAFREALDRMIARHARDGKLPVRNETVIWFGKVQQFCR